MDIFFKDGVNVKERSLELGGECFKDFVRVNCPHRLTCRYADLEKKKHCIGYLFDYRHQDGASMVVLKCVRAKKVVMVRIDNQHHSFLDDGAAELPDLVNQLQKIRCPSCDQRLFDAIVEKKLALRFKCSRDNRQLMVLLSETQADGVELPTHA